MDRPSLLDQDAIPFQERTDVFGDEFEVVNFDDSGIADGFRPNDRESDAGTIHQEEEEEDPLVRTVSAHYASHPIAPSIPAGPTRNSTRKSRSYVNPFASPEDDGPSASASERPQSLEFEPDSVARRSVSSASSHIYARTNSPRFGAGPSHPCGMYQQGTMVRTPSVTTTSTVRPSRQSYSQTVPQHPYTMYPQGVDDDLDDENGIEPLRRNPVSVGFPGLGQGYTRRIGPDGEDQDIIGDDGHTEQLPPYSKYPEDGPEKMPLLVPTPLHSRPPVAGTDPGMALMHTTLQPTPPQPRPQSMTDMSELNLRASRSSMSNVALLPSSSDDTSTNASTKSWKEKSWKEKRKTTFLGIPFWWILLTVCVLAFIAAVIGGAIGGFIAGGKHANEKATVTMYDASPIASPTGLAPTQGTFALTLGQPEEVEDKCLPNANQKVAWGCDLAPNAALGLVVSTPPDAKGTGAKVFYASYDTTIGYGVQLSNMNTSFAQFITVQDNDDPENGAAFYFQQLYDKIVVIPESAISLQDDTGMYQRRSDYVPSDFRIPEEWTSRKQVIAAGEKPWFCVWNDTSLEGFIYVQEPVSSTTSTFPTSTPPPNSTASSLSSSYITSPTAPPSPTTTPDVTNAFTEPWTITTYVGPAASFEAWRSSQVDLAKQTASAHYNNKKEDEPKQKREISSSDYWNTLDFYPYVIKLEERRLPNSIQPYCQQYQILDNGDAGPVVDPNTSNPIIVYLAEQDPSFGAYQSAGLASSKSRKRTEELGGCHCQWMSGG